MTEAATFVLSKQRNRTEVMLGAHLVAIIVPQGSAALYRFLLPGLKGHRLCDSPQKARRLILHVLAHWHAEAGPLYFEIAEVLAAQAEREKEAA